MATTYTRRINLYINGKEVTNDIISIRREMTKLTNEQARMIRGSQEYNKHAAGIKQLKSALVEHNKALVPDNQKMSFFSRMAEAFNRFEQMTIAAIAAIAGIAMVIKSTIEAFAEWDDGLADVMKTTSLTKEEAKQLSAELSKIDTRTAQNELLNLAYVAGKLGIRGTKDVYDFVEASNQIGVALARDLGGTEEAIREIGKITDIFNLKALYGQRDAILKVGSAMNELGMASTATEAYMVNFSKRVAGVAPQAGVAIEDVLGLAATLDSLGQRAEMSSTAYSKLMVTMTKKTEEFASVAKMPLDEFTALFNADANEAMVRVFEGMNQDADGFAKIVAILGDLEIEGQRMTSVFGALAKNTKMLRAQQDLSNRSFEEGISITNEYNLKNNTAQATLEKYKKQFVALQVELGERMMPLWGEVIKKASTLLKVIGVSFEFFMKHGKTIIWLTTTLIAYSVATKLATMWEERHNAAKGIGLALTKLSVFWNNAASAAMLLYQAAVAALAGNFTKALRAMQLFWAFSKLNPIGLLVAGVTALGLAFYALSQRQTAAQKLQQTLNDINLTAEQQIVEQRLQVEQLLRIAKEENNSKAERLAAIQELNKISPEYLSGLKLETINTDAATAASDKYILSLRKKAQLEASQEKLVEIEKELLDVQTGKGADPSFWQKTWNTVKTGGNVAAYTMSNVNTVLKNQTERTTELNLQKEKLIGLNNEIIKADLKQRVIVPDAPTNEMLIIEKQKELELARKMPDATEAEKKARISKISAITLEIQELRKSTQAYEENNDLIKEQETLLESAKLLPGTTLKEITVRNKKIETIERRLSHLKELGTSKQGDSGDKSDDESENKKLEALEAANEKENAIINQNYLNGLTSEKEYEAQLFAQKLKFFADKLTIYKAGSKEYQEAVNAALELQVEAEQKIHDLQLEADEELAQSKLENVTDEFEYQKQSEIQRWTEEKAALEKRLIDKAILSEKEIAFNDTIHEIIQEKEEAHRLKMNAIQTDQNIANLKKKVVIATPVNEKLASNDQIKALFDAKTALIEAQFDKELALAGDNQTDKLAAEQKYLEAMFALENEFVNAEGTNIDFRIALNKAMYDRGIIDKTRYEETLTQLTREAEDKRWEIKKKGIEDFNQIAGLASDAITAMMDLELEKAGEDEEKKKEIKKKYADINFAITVAQIISNTALAIMQALAQLGPIAGAIAAILIGGTGLLQIGLANSQRQAVKGLSEGGFTPPGGKEEPAGIVHKGEYVISQPMLANPQIRYIADSLERIRTKKISLRNSTLPMLSSREVNSDKGFSSGGFTSPSVTQIANSNLISPSSSSVTTGIDAETANRLISALDKFEKKKLVVYTELIKKDLETLSSIDKKREL